LRIETAEQGRTRTRRKRTREGSRRRSSSEREVQRWVEIQPLKRTVKRGKKMIFSYPSSRKRSGKKEAKETNLSSSSSLPPFLLLQPLHLSFQEDDSILKRRVSTLEILVLG